MSHGTPDNAQEAALTWHVLRRRVAASLIDLALCIVLAGAVCLAGLVLGILTLGLGFGLLMLLPAIPLLYHWLFISYASATPGQRLLGLALRRDSDLGPPEGIQALAWALGFALTLTFTGGLLWLLAVLVTRRKRALHDIVAGLAMVRTEALTPPPASWNMPPGGYTAR